MGVGLFEPMCSTHLGAYHGEKLVDDMVSRYSVVCEKQNKTPNCPQSGRARLYSYTFVLGTDCSGDSTSSPALPTSALDFHYSSK